MAPITIHVEFWEANIRSAIIEIDHYYVNYKFFSYKLNDISQFYVAQCTDLNNFFMFTGWYQWSDLIQ